MYDTKEISIKKINFNVGCDPEDVKKSLKIVLNKTLTEIIPEKKYDYPEDKEAFIQETLQKLVPEISEDEKKLFILKIYNMLPDQSKDQQIFIIK